MTEAEEKRRQYMAAYYRRRRAVMTPEQIEAERARRRVENPGVSPIGRLRGKW
jgi:hypothetical protein